jgi:peptidyl-tRNA hydrolase
MLFIVNGELKMGKGKICAQVGHAVIGAVTQL